MKFSNDPLQRLFEAAARAPGEKPEPMPASLENRVLSDWRGAGLEEAFSPVNLLLRRAILAAAVIMVLSIGCSWIESRSESVSKTALANFAMAIQLPP